MLQQILKDLYVDPEILSELDEDQKQILFVKMREEQVRRWKEREEKEVINKTPTPSKKKNEKKVNFLLGKDGEEWVWVMGEHKDDLSVEEILEREAQAKAMTLAEKEAEVLRQKQEEELKRKIEEEKKRIHEENERMERELKLQREKEREINCTTEAAKEEVAKISQLRHQYEEMEQKRLTELNEEQKQLRRRSQDAVETAKKRRSCEIYVKWKEKRQEFEKQAQEASIEVEKSFQVQEVKAKEAEKEMKEIAQRARLEYKESLRKTTNMIQAKQAFASAAAGSTTPPEKPPLPPKKHLINNLAAVAAASQTTVTNGTSGAAAKQPKPRPLRPRSRNMVIDWFNKEEKEKGAGLDPATGNVATWFHGVISRQEAEKMLAEKPMGAFIVRVSERVWGYTISYQERQRCKHFLIDTTDLGYQFFGANQLIHKSLADLVNFHKETPITITGRELLLQPVGQVSDPPDYCELFRGNKSQSTAL